jgi:Transmembrane domain of unknown function (DUF3566)
MADRRADDTPLAPRRTLSGPSHAAESNGETGKRPLSERVSSAVAAAGSAVQQAAGSTSANRSSSSGGTRPSSSGSGRATTSPSIRPGAAPRPRGTRRARLRLVHLDPWSVMKTSFLLSIAFGIVTWVAVFIVWSAIGAAGVFDNINNTVTEVLGTPAAEPFRIENYINTGKVMGFTTLLACADVLIITALATLGSFLYNIAATLLGGLEVTLASED